MRTMTRNKQVFYCANYIGKTEIKDEYGNLTGEYEIQYGNPVKVMGNISAAQGETQTRQFGESESYDKVIVLDNTDAVIDEYTVLWVDRMPILENDGSLACNEDGSEKISHDYVVKKVAKSLNSISIAISKVNVNG